MPSKDINKGILHRFSLLKNMPSMNHKNIVSKGTQERLRGCLSQRVSWVCLFSNTVKRYLVNLQSLKELCQLPLKRTETGGL